MPLRTASLARSVLPGNEFMTYGDIFVQIVHESTGLAKEYLESLLLAAVSLFPGKVPFDREVSDTKAHRMLDELRRDRASILSWCVKTGLKIPESNTGSA